LVVAALCPPVVTVQAAGGFSSACCLGYAIAKTKIF